MATFCRYHAILPEYHQDPCIDVTFDVFQHNTADILLITSEISYDLMDETLAIFITAIGVLMKKIIVKYTFNGTVHITKSD